MPSSGSRASSDAASSVQRIELAGKLRAFTVAAIHERMQAALGEAEELEVDLTGVTEIDGAGVQLLVAAKQEAAARQKILRFAGHSPVVRHTLELFDLAGYLGETGSVCSHT